MFPATAHNFKFFLIPSSKREFLSLIGGGEPFLNLDGLKMVVETALSLGMDIKYVETNSSWYRNIDSACQILSSPREIGLTALLISISPFHKEYIPFYKVKGVIETCNVVNCEIRQGFDEVYGKKG